MQKKHLALFASSQSDKQEDREIAACAYSWRRQATKDAARTHIPACFRSSTQAQSQGFPLSEREKKGYNITSFRLRERLVGVTGWRDSCHSLL